MRFSILGPLEILDDAGQAVPVSRPLHRSALSLLLLQAGQPCSAASLAAGLWGDEPPLSPVVSLRSCVYGIRKALPDASRLQTHPSGYLFSVRPGELDLHEFCDLADRGLAALDGGNPKAAAALLGQALSLWREPPLADLPATQPRERLLDRRKEVRDALADARLAIGEHRQVLAELRGTVTADPLREHAWAQLITALYRSGARAEALAAFGRLRMMLISAYGIDPGPELQELHKRVLADDPALLITTALVTNPATAGQAATCQAGDLVAARPVPVSQAAASQAAASQAAASQAAASQAGTGPAGRWQPAGQLPLAATDFSGPAAGFTGPAAELACLLGRLSGDGMAVTVVTGMLGAAKTAPGIGTCQCGRPVYLLVTGSQAAD